MSNQLKYAGIGSRGAPVEALSTMSIIAMWLAQEKDATLVSGGADGSDTAFENGAKIVGGKTEIWLPHLKFNKHPSTLLPSPDAFLVAPRYVPHWKSCGDFARRAHARNCHQVLGADLLTPVSFVVAWTYKGERIGGTATALNCAEDHGVPILNLGSKDWTEYEIIDFLERWS